MTKICIQLLTFSSQLYWQTIITICRWYLSVFQHCCLVSYTSWRWGCWPWRREFVVVFWKSKGYQWNKLNTQGGCYTTLLKFQKEMNCKKIICQHSCKHYKYFLGGKFLHHWASYTPGLLYLLCHLALWWNWISFRCPEEW